MCAVIPENQISIIYKRNRPQLLFYSVSSFMGAKISAEYN